MSEELYNKTKHEQLHRTLSQHFQEIEEDSTTKVYPAFFTMLDRCILIEVPDLNILTEGKDLYDAINMTRDAIGLMCISMEDEGKEIPKPSDIRDLDVKNAIFVEEGETIISLVDLDTDMYRECLRCPDTKSKEIKRLYKDMGENGSEENLRKILETIAPYVIVTGSYAYGNQTESSDIDMFVKALPEEEIDCEAEYIEESYTRALIRFFESLGYEWDSVFLDSFSIGDTFIPLEFSSYYDIEEETFPIEILGVKMLASKSNHTSEKYLNGRKRNRV